jgi:hypothetical protein
VVPGIGTIHVFRDSSHQPGVVDEHVHAAELLGRGLNERIHFGAPGYVDLHGRGLTASALDVSHNCLKPIHATRAEEHAGAFAGQVTRGGFAEAAAGSSDDDDLSFNVRHAAPLS